MAEWKIVCNDIMTWCEEYTGPKFHAMLTDCPYEMKFMGKVWDGTGISFQKETWAALAEHLLPGGFLFVFASSRGWHRLACALEDAGLIIQPSIFNWHTREVVEVPFCLGWATGQSFPKSSRIDTGIDKAINRIGESIIELKRAIRKRFNDSGLTLKQLNESCGFEASGYLRESSTWATVLPSREKWEKMRGVLNCDRQLDKLFDEAEREVVGKSKWSHQKGIPLPNTYDGQRQHLDITSPATPLARAWEGHRYGGQILKNALEPIIVAQKPWTDKRLDCIVETGAGALWVDGGRIEGARGDGVWGTDQINCQGTFNASPDNKGYHTQQHPQGRWPANFILCHVPPDENGEGGCRRVGVKRVKPTGGRGETNRNCKMMLGQMDNQDSTTGPIDPDGMETVDDFVCVPECPARRLGEQGGESKSTRSMRGDLVDNRGDNYGRAGGKRIADSNYMRGHNDKGTAARYFFQADWEYECAEGCPVARLDEQAGERKSGGGEHTRSTAPSVALNPGHKPLRNSTISPSTGGASRYFKQADWSHEVAERLAGADPVRYQPKAARKERNQNLDDFYWRKDKAAPTGFVRIDKDEWEELGCEEERIYKETGKRVSLRAKGNIHPTCKPVSLNKHIATLLLPPKEYAPRRILIPFFGSGSEGIGAGLAGWEEIVGIDFEQDYCDIAESRLGYWLNRSNQLELL